MSTTSATASRKTLRLRKDRVDKQRRVKWQQWPESMCQLDDLDEQSLTCRYPDLEDGSLIAWGLRQSQDSKGENVEIDVLYGDGTDLKWERNLDDTDLLRIMELRAPALRVCFVDTLKSDSSWLPGNFSPRQETIRILRDAGLSGVLLCNMYSEQSYWAKMGNQRYMQYDDKGALSSYEICYQFRCGWDTGVSFIHLKRSKLHTIYFCINYPSGARDRVEAIFCHEKRRAVLHRDFFFDTLVADDSLKQWQVDIGQRRLRLLEIEKNVGKPKAPMAQQHSDDAVKDGMPDDKAGFFPTKSRKHKTLDPEQQPAGPAEEESTIRSHAVHTKPETKIRNKPSEKDNQSGYDLATRELHIMVRHWLVLRQDCEDLLAQLRFLHDTSNRVCEKKRAHWPVDWTSNPSEAFEALISQCDICMRWTQVYHDRTQMHINLLFHLANQRTAADTARIAEQTQRDSASMITIAAVTMAFLPGTFICAIVSTSFFDFGDAGLHVSEKWWVLVATAVPLTVVVFGVWWGWKRMRVAQLRAKEYVRALEMRRSGMRG